MGQSSIRHSQRQPTGSVAHQRAQEEELRALLEANLALAETEAETSELGYDPELADKSPEEILKILKRRERAEKLRGPKRRVTVRTLQRESPVARGGSSGSKGSTQKKKGTKVCRTCHLEACQCNEKNLERLGENRSLYLPPMAADFIKDSRKNSATGRKVRVDDLLGFLVTVQPLIPSLSKLADWVEQYRGLVTDDGIRRRGRPIKIGGESTKKVQARFRPSVLEKLEALGVNIEFGHTDGEMTLSDAVHTAVEIFTTMKIDAINHAAISGDDIPEGTNLDELRRVTDWVVTHQQRLRNYDADSRGP